MTTPIQKTGASFARGSSKQDYETPPDFLRAVENKFGRLAFDLAARTDNKKAPKFYGLEDDSLVQLWRRIPGICWLNPPFDKISPWAMKCATESKLGARILFLVPASVGSNWFADFVHDKAHVYLLNGRLQFVGAKDPYPKDCILAAYGFGKSGYSVWRWK